MEKHSLLGVAGGMMITFSCHSTLLVLKMFQKKSLIFFSVLCWFKWIKIAVDNVFYLAKFLKLVDCSIQTLTKQLMQVYDYVRIFIELNQNNNIGTLAWLLACSAEDSYQLGTCGLRNSADYFTFKLKHKIVRVGSAVSCSQNTKFQMKGF